MFVNEKKLQYPVRIANPNPKLAAFIISQYGAPDGELGASLRYLSQRYTMPYPELKALLTDIGVEELGHLEMVMAKDTYIQNGEIPVNQKGKKYTFFRDDLIKWLESGCKIEAPISTMEINQILSKRPRRRI